MGAGRLNLQRGLSDLEIREVLEEGLPPERFRNKRVLVLTPDQTRTAPLPRMVRLLIELAAQASRLDFMVALGTHRPLRRQEIQSLYGIDENDGALSGKTAFFNHRWDRPGTLVSTGVIDGSKIAGLTGGVFRDPMDITINRKVFDYDLLLILGPVFPHEVAGFSGGNKYLFPGISGGDFLHRFHWLGAVITSWNIIGIKNTPVRKLIDEAARMVDVERLCAAMVVTPENELAGLFTGETAYAWSEAADLSSSLHIVRKRKPFHTVLARASENYDELWTAGKAMYKLEPVVEDGGTLIIYGKHIHAISHTWGRYIEETGYHVRDYFTGRLNEFTGVPLGVLAHLSHVKGLGTYENGVERPRINVVLATSIPEERCRHVNLGYLDPDKVRIEDYRGRESEGVLLVDGAGEVLYRLEETAE